MRHKLYSVWAGMKERCSNPNHIGFASYGGRGIFVCDRWKESFQAFLEDMGNRPSSSHSIERKDNDGPYCQENCRWATNHEQSRNKRNNRRLTFNGETMILKDWANKFGVTIATLFEAVDTVGPDEALSRAEARFASGRKAMRLTEHRGSQVNTSKLTESQAREIKSLLRAGPSVYGSVASIARAYGVSWTAIRLIRDGINWAWLEVA